MKQGKLVRTRNVVEADEAINLLVTRPKVSPEFKSAPETEL